MTQTKENQTPAAKVPRLKVEATRIGYYNLRRVREGEAFAIQAGEFSAAWMKPAGSIPEDFADEVSTKMSAFESRPTASELRQKADSLSASSLRSAVAQGVADGVELAEARRRHEELRRAAGSPATPGAGEAAGGSDKGSDGGGKKPQK